MNDYKTAFKSIFNEQLPNDANDSCFILTTRLNCLYEQFVPLRTKRVKKSKSDWINREVIGIMRKRDRIKSKFNKLKGHNVINNDLFEQYKQLRNEVNIKCRELKKSYHENKINNCRNNTKELWKVMSEVVNTKNANKKINKTWDVNVDELNNYFIRSTLSSEVNQTFNINNDLILLTDKTFNLPEVSAEEVENTLSNLNARKATGMDGISSKILKLSAVFLAPILAFLINLSFSTTIVPDIWKTARITPLHKGGDKKDFNNYRPISVLPIMNKVMEKMIFKSLLEYLTTNKLLSEHQFGFRSRISCADALLKIQNCVNRYLNSKKIVVIITLDFRKAFDSISHELLLQKLYCLGFSWKAILWFRSYLDNRRQCVRLKNNTSKSLRVSRGVAQGSILAPILFSIFVNGLCDLMISICDVILYADDTTLIFAADTYEELEKNINEGLVTLSTWITNNKLSLNVMKSNYMVINISGRRINDLNIVYGETSLPRVKSTKILGVIFDERLSFKEHIEKISKKIKNRINFLSRVRHILPIDSVNTVFKALVLPLMDYGICLYGYTYKSHLNIIERLQKRAARIITCGSNEDYATLFKRLVWMPYNQRIAYFSCVFIYKCLHGLGSTSANEYFNYIPNTCRTRNVSNNSLQLPNYKLTACMNTIFYSGVKVWNNIDINLRSVSNYKSFANKIRTHFYNL
jgi:hypothetical protein